MLELPQIGMAHLTRSVVAAFPNLVSVPMIILLVTAALLCFAFRNFRGVTCKRGTANEEKTALGEREAAGYGSVSTSSQIAKEQSGKTAGTEQVKGLRDDI